MKVLHLYAGNLYGGVERLLGTFARLRHLARVSDIDPGPRPETLHLEPKHLGIDVDVAVDPVCFHQPLERCGVVPVSPHAGIVECGK